MTLKNHLPLTAERLREVLSYDPLTGVFLWKVSTSRRVSVGSVAGYTDQDGYLRIRIDRVGYRAHRLAWLYMHGEWPADQIDHRNRSRMDNRIENLREATNGENSQNREPKRAKPSGLIGVNWHARDKRWIAQIMVDGRSIHLGSFTELEKAAQARADAKAKLHNFQPYDRAS